MPTLGNGKVCYIEIPALDIQLSADFYSKIFGWQVRQRGNGSTAFNDAVGEVSGTWVLNRPPATAPGFLIYIMVDSVAETVEVAPGVKVTTPLVRLTVPWLAFETPVSVSVSLSTSLSLDSSDATAI